MLRSEHPPVLLPLGRIYPAETKERRGGGAIGETREGDRINANLLVHTSKFYKPPGQDEGAQNIHTGASGSGSLLLLHKRGDTENC